VGLKEAAVLDGFAGGDDAELGGALGGCGRAGGHVLEGVEADDLGHLSEADAGVARRCGGEGADGSDAGDAREERVAEFVDCVSDGGYATKASNDNTIQVGSFLKGRLLCGYVNGLGGHGGCFFFLEHFDAADYISYGFKIAEGIVGDLDGEGFFDLEGDVDLVEGIDVELLEGGVEGDGVRGNALRFRDDFNAAILHRCKGSFLY
jgi:hypothetical protein